LTAANRVPLVLDPAPARDLPPEILKKVTWITPNETEAQFYAGVDAIGASDSELKNIAQCFLDLGPQNVLLKLGERGAFLATRKGTTRRIHAHKVDVKDTTAAGDAYNGAFAVALLRDSSPEEAAEFAAAAAAVCVTRHGAQPSMPSQHEVEILRGQQPVTMLQSMAAAIPWDGQ
jgi:ribokinase